MATYTTNLNLKKPSLTDSASIGDINNNMDILDNAIGNIAEFDTGYVTIGNMLICYGVKQITIPANTTYGEETVTFPFEYKGIPNIQVTLVDRYFGNVYRRNPSATGFTVGFHPEGTSASASTRNISWLAIGEIL